MATQSDRNPSWVFKAFRVHDRLEAVGLADPAADPRVEMTTHDTVVAMVAADLETLREAGLARNGRLALMSRPNAADLAATLDEVLDALEHNPLPDTEWGAVRDVLGDDLLAALTGTSLVSLRRYAAGTRVTPDDVAIRLHFVALVNADLAGSYNALGMRRWWQRSRTQLDGRSPIEALGAEWDPDTSAAAAVRDLAGALVGAGAAS